MPWIIIGSTTVHHKSVLVRHTTDGQAPERGSASACEWGRQPAGSPTPGGAPVLRSPAGRDLRKHRSRGTARAGVPPPFAARRYKRSALAGAGAPRHAPSLMPLTANQETFLAILGIYGELRITKATEIVLIGVWRSRTRDIRVAEPRSLESPAGIASGPRKRPEQCVSATATSVCLVASFSSTLCISGHQDRHRQKG